jgi:hypothetical protein
MSNECFDFLNNSEIFLIQIKIQRDIHKCTSSCTSTSCSYQILMKLKIFSIELRKILISDLIKSVQEEPGGSIRTDRQADMTKLIIDFCNFANSSKNWQRVLNLDCDLVLNEISVCYCRFQVLWWIYLVQKNCRRYDIAERRCFMWCVCVTLN